MCTHIHSIANLLVLLFDPSDEKVFQGAWKPQPEGGAAAIFTAHSTAVKGLSIMDACREPLPFPSKTTPRFSLALSCRQTLNLLRKRVISFFLLHYRYRSGLHFRFHSFIHDSARLHERRFFAAAHCSTPLPA